MHPDSHHFVSSSKKAIVGGVLNRGTSVAHALLHRRPDKAYIGALASAGLSTCGAQGAAGFFRGPIVNPVRRLESDFARSVGLLCRSLEFLQFLSRKLIGDTADRPPKGRRGHLPLVCTPLSSSGRSSVQGGSNMVSAFPTTPRCHFHG